MNEKYKRVLFHVKDVYLCVLYSEAFEPMMESGELVVRYRARRTYSRRTTEATREFAFSLATCKTV